MMADPSDISAFIPADLSARRTPISNLRGLSRPPKDPRDVIAGSSHGYGYHGQAVVIR
jgi:hypothetical protein